MSEMKTIRDEGRRCGKHPALPRSNNPWPLGTPQRQWWFTGYDFEYLPTPPGEPSLPTHEAGAAGHEVAIRSETTRMQAWAHFKSEEQIVWLTLDEAQRTLVLEAFLEGWDQGIASREPDEDDEINPPDLDLGDPNVRKMLGPEAMHFDSYPDIVIHHSHTVRDDPDADHYSTRWALCWVRMT